MVRMFVFLSHVINEVVLIDDDRPHTPFKSISYLLFLLPLLSAGKSIMKYDYILNTFSYSCVCVCECVCVCVCLPGLMRKGEVAVSIGEQ